MRTLVSCSCLAVLLWALSGDLLAEDKLGKDKAEPKIDRITLEVHVVDPNGTPVPGAQVRPTGFRTKVERASHWSWVEQYHGKQPTIATNEKGVATFKIPKYVHEKLEIGEVTWIVDHNNFVVGYADKSVDKRAKIALKDGYRIAATAVDDDGEPIAKDVYAVVSGYRWSIGPEWRTTKTGMLLSRVFGHERSKMRIVHLPKDKPARFSKPLVVTKPDGGRRIVLKDIKLEAGTRVEGKLDDNVSRPVKNGRVVAYISSGAKDEERQQLWNWNDVVEIQADGNFVFASLPRGDVVQMIAICDGWLSKNPTMKELLTLAPWGQRGPSTTFKMPQLAALDANKVTPTLAMEKEAICRVSVVKPDGKPLAGAKVLMWPNHIWLRGGSTICASGFRTADLLRHPDYHSDFWKKLIEERGERFSAATNDEGIAVIRNLPALTSVGIGASHDDYQQPIAGRDRSTDVNLVVGETTELVIKMQEKGKDVLGE